ncbi:hypothetical protein [Aureimonas phyllosphaerae]|uniref:Plasmid segregation centromere-binding protein ParG n=1 Tax=Aureimonas phyllosphaerae TaxID=1166078 RepID=A0A7W6BU34_9HYPH|nr:hypothetical protein [Aureimonas phyllosphaerae]MBB3938044.1 hypothetical protein [Aureimonas phyllosphaerae]MBB3962080.1 hypothetical protein [Aureimonas phyllosphaerae]SFF55002.1 hypothetical protein SAMN05216566_1266 [Aureimonas phyllosphaerae]
MSKKVAFSRISSTPPATADEWIAQGAESEGRALHVVPDTPKADEPQAEAAKEAPRKMVRFTLDVDAELHQRIKVACAMRGEKMSDVLRRVFEKEFPAA